VKVGKGLNTSLDRKKDVKGVDYRAGAKTWVECVVIWNVISYLRVNNKTTVANCSCLEVCLIKEDKWVLSRRQCSSVE
jgi:hypothetical protein